MNEKEKTAKINYGNQLDQIMKELEPKVSAEKSGLTTAKYAKFISQRPYELSSSSDHSDWAGSSD